MQNANFDDIEKKTFVALFNDMQNGNFDDFEITVCVLIEMLMTLE